MGWTIHSRRLRMGLTALAGRILPQLPRMGFRRTAGSFATWCACLAIELEPVFRMAEVLAGRRGSYGKMR
jgi:hypothetical protein